MTPFTCVPIPDKLQSNYPISADKKAEYDNADYYGVYKCDIAFNCLYEKGNEVINTNDQVDQYIEDELKGDNSDKVKVEDVDYTPSDVSILQVSLTKSSQSDDVSQVDFLNNPVTITFKNQELNLTKTLVIDSYSKITDISQIILEKGTWSYEISSNVVLFEKFLGNFKIEKDNNIITFNYEYHDNFIVASVCLNPIATIDKTQINLATYPVKIILNNSKHTYQFLFNSNSMLDEKITQMVELGSI